MARTSGQDPHELGRAIRKKRKGLPPSSRGHECVKHANRASDALKKAIGSFASLEKLRHECDDHGDTKACKRRTTVAKDASEAMSKAKNAFADLTICVAKRRQRRKR